jgi:hypothetical protein
MISREQSAELAELYVRFQNSLRPLSIDRAAAGREFNKLLNTLHSAHGADLPFDAFRRSALEQCRDYLRKNKAP